MKKKIFLIALAACLITLSVAGSSLAYFTDIASESNVFTAGNVYIELSYEGLDSHFFPGQTYADVDASVENVGSELAYIGAIIEMSKANLSTILTETGETDNIPAAIATVFVGLDANTLKYVETTDGYTIYAVVENPVAVGTAVDIFTAVAIPREWDNAQMANFNSLTVEVTAYAVQTVGFDNATNALTTAFADWADYNTNAQPEQESEG